MFGTIFNPLDLFLPPPQCFIPLRGSQYLINDMKILVKPSQRSSHGTCVSQTPILFYFAMAAYFISNLFHCWNWDFSFTCIWLLYIIYRSTFYLHASFFLFLLQFKCRLQISNFVNQVYFKNVFEDDQISFVLLAFYI